MAIWGECGSTRPRSEAFLNINPNANVVDNRYPCGLLSSAGSGKSALVSPNGRVFLSNLVIYTTQDSDTRTGNAVDITNGDLYMVNTFTGGFANASALTVNSNVFMIGAQFYQVGDIPVGAPESGLNFIVPGNNPMTLFLDNSVFHTENLEGYGPVYVGASTRVPTVAAPPTLQESQIVFNSQPTIIVLGGQMFFSSENSFGDGCLGLCIGFTGAIQPLVYMDDLNANGIPNRSGAAVTATRIQGGQVVLDLISKLTQDTIRPPNAQVDNWLQGLAQDSRVPGANDAVHFPGFNQAPLSPIAAAPPPSKSGWKVWYTIVIVVLVVALALAVLVALCHVMRKSRAAAEARNERKQSEHVYAQAPPVHAPYASSLYPSSQSHKPPSSQSSQPYGTSHNVYVTEPYTSAALAGSKRAYVPQYDSQGVLYEPPQSYGSQGSAAAAAAAAAAHSALVAADSSSLKSNDRRLLQPDGVSLESSLGGRAHDPLTAGSGGGGGGYYGTLEATTKQSNTFEGARVVRRDYEKDLEELEASLDAVDDAHHGVLLSRYKLLGPTERRAGGQGLVQFAELLYNQKRQVAIKFFLSRHAFNVEQAHYANPALQRVLPPVDDVVSNDDGALRDPYGRPFPPLVVAEKGESLDEWRRRMQAADFASRMHIIIHLVERVALLHGFGFVHRDLKPSNTIYLQSRNEWTLIDFGSCAKIGAMCRPSMSIAYAAPEVVLAFSERQREFRADPATDVWALGVMAYELLANMKVFGGPRGETSMVYSTMKGEHLLPWEEDTPEARAHDKKLGFMGTQIKAMLRRNPRERASLRSVHSAWKRMLQAETATYADTAE